MQFSFTVLARVGARQSNTAPKIIASIWIKRLDRRCDAIDVGTVYEPQAAP
jgi:hypothetical protein